ncbi:MAG: ribokinase [Desulfobacterales bacterium]|nr:ribokinase [Desulfobacterales bacterium]
MPLSLVSTDKTSLFPSGFDVCVVGHVTTDIIKVGRKTTIIPGGTAYYTSMALRRLGLNVAVLTKGASKDSERLLRELRDNKITVLWRKGKATAVFENIYSQDAPDARSQQIKAIGTPFLAEEAEGIRAGTFHLGPLTRQDIPLQLLKQLSAKAKIVSLDVQGMLRPSRMGPVVLEDWAEKQQWLECVNILKADESEALIVSGQQRAERAAEVLASFGAKEVVITLGSRGSLIHTGQSLYKIPALAPRKIGDSTGCGDTYMGGYLYARLRGTPPEAAGRFAAAMAALKLEGIGPFSGSKADVLALLSGK